MKKLFTYNDVVGTILHDDSFEKRVKSENLSGKFLIINTSGGYGVCWLKDGLLHRNKKPAVIWNSGTCYFYKEGKEHNLTGPSVSVAKKDSIKSWSRFHIEGVEINYINFKEEVRKYKLKSFK